MRSIRGGLVRAVSSWLQLPLALRLLAPVAVMLTLWSLSSQPSSGGTQHLALKLLSNGAHLVAYFGLAGAWLLALLSHDDARRAMVTRDIIGVTVGLSVLYGIVDEVHQSFVPGRAPSIWDIVTDACGSAMAVLFVFWVLSGERRFVTRLLTCMLLGFASVVTGTLLDG